MEFENTGLPDTPELRQALDLSHGIFIKKAGAAILSLDDDEKAEVFKVIGVQDIDDYYAKSVLRMASFLQEAELGNDVIAASIYAGAAKFDPTIMRKIISDDVAEITERYIRWDQEMAEGLQAAKSSDNIQELKNADDPVKEYLRISFKEAASANPERIGQEFSIFMKLGAILLLEQFEKIREHEPDAYEYIRSYAEMISEEVEETGTSVDKELEDGLSAGQSPDAPDQSETRDFV